MRSALVAVVLVLVGCASTQDREALDPTSNPSWLPPGQGDLEVADKEEAPKVRPRPRARSLQQPNHRETESRIAAAQR